MNSSSQLKKLIPREGPTHSQWMIQLSSEARELWLSSFLPNSLLDKQPAALGNDFFSFSFTENVTTDVLLDSIFPRWICPVEHQWPVSPRVEKFVEKASLGVLAKLGVEWEELQVLSTTPDLKNIANGVRGRLFQLKQEKQIDSNYQSLPRPQILCVLIHSKGILAGRAHGKLALGTCLTGGLGFLEERASDSTHQASTPTDNKQSGSAAKARSRTSRAGGKISEVLALLKIVGLTARDYPHWLELGAAPGGMTEALVKWGAQVTAVDPAALAPAVQKLKKVRHLRINAEEIASAAEFDAILCDMNGPTFNSSRIVSNLIESLPKGALVVHTLKVPTWDSLHSSREKVIEEFKRSGAEIIAVRHLFHNRKEVTILAVKI